MTLEVERTFDAGDSVVAFEENDPGGGADVRRGR
jgi:hypothetical protein